MRGLYMTFARRAHDVVENGSEFEDLKTLLAEIVIATNVSIPETKHMSKLVSQRASGKVARRKRHIPSDQAVRCLSAGGQNRAVLRKLRGMGSDVDTIPTLQ